MSEPEGRKVGRSGSTSFLEPSEVAELGLGQVGSHVLISRYAVLHNPGNIFVGHHVRIDDFCLITAGDEQPVRIGNWVHLAPFRPCLAGVAFLWTTLPACPVGLVCTPRTTTTRAST